MSGDGSQQITRHALGRDVALGSPYDATTDKFCGPPIFRRQLPPTAISKTDNQHSDIEFAIVNNLQDRLKNLDISGELQVSALCGKFGLSASGSAAYLNHEKNSFKSVESTLRCRIKTVTEKLQIFYDEVRDCVSQEALRVSGATHVVIGIEWGANCVIAVTDQNSENKSRKEVEGNLKMGGNYLKVVAEASVSAAAKSKCTMQKEWNKFQLKIFADLIPEDTIPLTFDGALAFLAKVPQLIRTSNNGKGKPISCIMVPVSHLVPEEPSRPVATFRSVGDKWVVDMVQLFDRINEFKQKANDQFEEMKIRPYCVTDEQREKARRAKESLEREEASVRDELAKLLQAIRSAKKEAESLSPFCDTHFKKASDSSRVCEEIFRVAQPRIEFRKRCEGYGVKYLEPPVEQRIARACDECDNVFVLVHGQGDAKTTKENECEFIERAKKWQEVWAGVDRVEKTRELLEKVYGFDLYRCYITWPKQSENIAIKHYRKGKLLYGDLLR